MLHRLVTILVAPTVLLAMSIGTALAQKTSSFSIGDFKFDLTDPALAPSTEPQKRFLSDYRAARAAGDAAAMRRLVHPASTACMVSTTARDYFASRMQKEVDATLPVTAAIIFVPVPADSSLLPGMTGVTVLPITPTQFLAIDYAREVFDDKGVLVKSIGATIVRQLAFEGGELRLVEYCLTPKGEELFAKKKAGVGAASAPK